MGMFRSDVRAFGRAGAMTAIFVSGLVAQGALAADYTESLSVALTGGYTLSNPTGIDTAGGGPVGLSGRNEMTGKMGGSQYNLQYNYEATLVGNTGFSFLNDLRCVGACTSSVTTQVTDRVVNTGADALSLRFDSMITPGHISLQSPTLIEGTQFTFRVYQNTYDALGNMTTTELYYADGGVHGINTPEGLPFNDLNIFQDANQIAYDWGGTNLALPMAVIPVGGYAEVIIDSTTTASAGGYCADFKSINCVGAQISFGDPRDNGGSADLQAFDLMARGSASASSNGGTPVIDRKFGALFVPTRVVTLDTPLLPEPPYQPPFPYGPGNFIPGVPEPASWALMLSGFGMIGGAMRHRRRVRVRFA